MESVVEYRDIEGFPGYRVGSDGTFWTRKRIGAHGALGEEWRLMKPDVNKYGHALIAVMHNGVKSRRYAHHFVLEAFVGKKPAKHFVARHLNDIGSDNRVENLAWGSLADNYRDRYVNGTACKGSGHHKSKLSEDQVFSISQDLQGGLSAPCIAKKHRVSISCVSAIKGGYHWNHITGGKSSNVTYRPRRPWHEIEDIVERSKSGEPHVSIAKVYDLHPITIGRIVKRYYSLQ